MALVAVRAVVYIATHALVMLVRRRLCVANRARKHRVVARIGVAIATDFCIAMVLGEPCVIKRRARP